MISGILAGGIPGFRIELCCFFHPLAGMACVFFVGCPVALPYHTEMIQGYHLLHQLTHFTHELESVTLLFCLCGLPFGLVVFAFLCFCVFVFLCFCVLLVFGALLLFGFVFW